MSSVKKNAACNIGRKAISDSDEGFSDECDLFHIRSISKSRIKFLYLPKQFYKLKSIPISKRIYQTA